MDVSVESVGSLERRMTVAVPAERLESEVARRLKGLSKQVRMPGFRPGKVPIKMVEAQYGQQVLQEAAGELIQRSFEEAVGSQGLRPAGGPRIEPKSLARGQNLEYVATFEVFPEVPHNDLKGVTIRRPVCEPADAEIDETLETMRKQRVEWRPVERAGADGDRVTMDFQGSIEGEPIEGGQATDYALVLGSGRLIDELEKQVAGLTAGTNTTLKIRFPDDYRNTELAGRTADFDVQIKEVAEPVLPEVDEEFARSFGISEGGVTKLREEVLANLKREVEDKVRGVVHERVMNALLERNPVDVPAQLLNVEIDQLIERNRALLQRSGASPDLANVDRSVYEDTARRRVALGLVLAEFAQHSGLQPSPERVRQTLERMAVSYEEPEKFIAWHYENPQRLEEVHSATLEEMLVEHLLDTADVVDEQVSFKDLMYSGRAADNQTERSS